MNRRHESLWIQEILCLHAASGHPNWRMFYRNVFYRSHSSERDPLLCAHVGDNMASRWIHRFSGRANKMSESTQRYKWGVFSGKYDRWAWIEPALMKWSKGQQLWGDWKILSLYDLKASPLSPIPTVAPYASHSMDWSSNVLSGLKESNWESGNKIMSWLGSSSLGAFIFLFSLVLSLKQKNCIQTEYRPSHMED